MVTVVLAVLAVIAIFYGAAGVFVYFYQRSRQYRPTHLDPQGRGQGNLRPWRAASGEFLGYFRPAVQPRRLVIFFHGGGGEALDRNWIEELVSPSDLIVLPEYQGYGARRGRFSERQLLPDAENLLTQAQAEWGKLPVLAVGERLGSAIVAHLAAQGKVDRVALISPFASSEAIVAPHYRFFPFAWLVRGRLSTVEFAKGSDAPMHMVHGTLDEFIPIHQSQAVFRAYRGTRKAFDEVPGFGGGNLDQAILHSPFTARFREFMAE